MIFPNPMMDTTLDTFKIVEIDRWSVFAGRMGREVHETWRVEKGGKTYTVVVSPYHTNVAGTRMFEQGDSVTIDSPERNGTIRTTLSQVKR